MTEARAVAHAGTASLATCFSDGGMVANLLAGLSHRTECLGLLHARVYSHAQVLSPGRACGRCGGGDWYSCSRWLTGSGEVVTPHKTSDISASTDPTRWVEG